jgi:hypothetical protein
MIAAVMMTSCAGIDIDTTEKKYLAARTELNLFIEQYVDIQRDVSEADHQRVKEAFYRADAILDIWEMNLGNDYDFTEDYKSWIEVKSLIMQILMEVYRE